MGFCQCEKDGWCELYKQEMAGRVREICMGDNVDIGTAAVLRDQWRRSAGPQQYNVERSILLEAIQAPGDTVVATAAIYSLHKAYPGRFLTAVETPWPEVFINNPNVTPIESNFEKLRMHYPAIHDSNKRGIHFMEGYCEFIGAALGIHVPLLTNRPHLYFDSTPPDTEELWVVCSGGKDDFTNKLWGHHNYQAVVELLGGRVKFIQVGCKTDNHIPLCGAIDVIGATNLRELFDIVREARGVLCGVSLLMHVAAALEKPAVVIAGGREPIQWNAYPKQHYIHTIGALPCTAPQGETGACWRSRTVPLGNNEFLDRDTCLYPVGNTLSKLPKCMTLISPAEVAEKILLCNGGSNSGNYAHS